MRVANRRELGQKAKRVLRHVLVFTIEYHGTHKTSSDHWTRWQHGLCSRCPSRSTFLVTKTIFPVVRWPLLMSRRCSEEAGTDTDTRQSATSFGVTNQCSSSRCTKMPRRTCCKATFDATTVASLPALLCIASHRADGVSEEPIFPTQSRPTLKFRHVSLGWGRPGITAKVPTRSFCHNLENVHTENHATEATARSWKGVRFRRIAFLILGADGDDQCGLPNVPRSTHGSSPVSLELSGGRFFCGSWTLMRAIHRLMTYPVISRRSSTGCRRLRSFRGVQ